MKSLQGRKNTYTCEACGFVFVTIDRDVGATPMITSCRSATLCRGAAQSGWYEIDQSQPASYEWYKPDDAEIRDITSAQVLGHIKMGGLLLRKLSPQ